MKRQRTDRGGPSQTEETHSGTLGLRNIM
ncbi:rCG37689 [Rattus norvegicus]|uniref:RCG37689 n=1 Tax=Rattus norvegicus TaxID=10116 RepID=A6JF70_RAT|nr:rCG37689 [Rattus norvegicus]